MNAKTIGTGLLLAGALTFGLAAVPADPSGGGYRLLKR